MSLPTAHTHAVQDRRPRDAAPWVAHELRPIHVAAM
jgi:hypothetical protein